MILIPTPIGQFRFEPLRDLKRLFLWLTAPKSSRVVAHVQLTDREVEFRSMTDAELLSYTDALRESKKIGYWCEASGEARRRGLDPLKPLPQWVDAIRNVPFEYRRGAERFLRPEGI